MKEKRIQVSTLFMFLTTAIFLLSFLLLSFIGANVYRSVVKAQQENGNRRAVTSYLVTAIEESDPDTIEISKLDANQMLIVIPKEGTKYARKLYVSDGMLVEDFTKLNAPLLEEHTVIVGETENLYLVEEKPGLYLLITDYGEIHIACNTKGGN